MYHQHYSVSRLHNYIKHAHYGYSDEYSEFWQAEIIHPYLGFVYDYKDADKNNHTLGFITPSSPLIKREPGKLNVVILGGSVAQGIAKVLEAAFQQACRVPPNLVALGFAGYKQPQQLLALNYFLSLGAEYDLVINLDGYNDIVLVYSDNYRVGVNPFFPRNWNLRISRQPSRKVLAVIGKVRYLRDRKEEKLAALASGFFFNWSAVYGLAKIQEFKKINWEINRTSNNLIKLQQEEVKGFEETGPICAYQDLDQLYRDAAAVWERGSVLLDRLARANGMEYYHFLQPNQYVEGSKVLNKEEQRIAYAPHAFFAEPAIIGYPLLIRQGRNLVEQNVKFFDATMIFAPVKETIYIDTCCHFNERGKEILADYIMKKIAPNPKINKFFKDAAGGGESKN